MTGELDEPSEAADVSLHKSEADEERRRVEAAWDDLSRERPTHLPEWFSYSDALDLEFPNFRGDATYETGPAGLRHTRSDDIAARSETELLKDRVEVNFHDADKPLQAGGEPTDRKMAWSTPFETAVTFQDEEEVKDALALPDAWGRRNEVTVFRVPAEEEAERIEGVTAPKPDGDDGRERPGGAPQTRWREWDSSWDHVTMTFDEFRRLFGREGES